MTEIKEKPNNSFVKYVIRGAIVFAVLVLIIWMLGLTFPLIYPSTAVTQHLIPFQNNFLTFTSAFTTSDTFSGFFSDDSGPAIRFGILLMVAVMLTLLFKLPLSWIPLLRTHLNTVAYGIFFFLLAIAFSYAVFIPGTLTVFNSEKRQLEVTTIEWSVMRKKIIVPYHTITGFSMNLDKGEGGDVESGTTIHAQLFAEMGTEKILVAENIVDTYRGDITRWKLSNEKQEEVDNAIQAMKQLTDLPKN
jgi:hypothetical protein